MSSKKLTLTERVALLEARNRRVENDKGWETSWVRRLSIMGLTYLTVSFYLHFVVHISPLGQCFGAGYRLLPIDTNRPTAEAAMDRSAGAKIVMSRSEPRVGVGVFIVKDGRFIMLKRHGSHGVGTWGLVGGNLDFGESWEECARRETSEEVGVEITNIRFLAVTNDIFLEEQRHYATIFLRADWVSGEPQILESDKCTAIDWFSYNKLPENCFLPVLNLKAQQPDLDLA